MNQISVQEAALRLPELVKTRAESEPVVITDGSKPVALLMVLPQDQDELDLASDAKPVFGSCRGLLGIQVEDDEHLRGFPGFPQ